MKFYLLCRILRHNFILNNAILLQSFIHGAYKEVQKGVLSDERMNLQVWALILLLVLEEQLSKKARTYM
ncbi:hypothetical protein B0A70_05870 [Chryseobacterium piscicola]|uniref:Uncharacterized protein n=1 Tax=Chryseobacterium piscicola TaxID=551459 RepID=A0A2S7KGQ8_9FLAO|nr:hypothetical protein B0A70_05870 [Chryseobacterium piscicola]